MIPNFEEFWTPFFKIMSDGKEHALKDLTIQCGDLLNLSQEERSEMTRGGTFTKVYDRTQWTATYLRKAGIIENTRRGVYILTPRGQSLVDQGHTVLNKGILKQFPEYVQFTTPYRRETSSSNVVENAIPEQTPFEVMEEANVELREELVNELLETIKHQTPKFFEKLVLELLVAMGYGGSFHDAARVTQYSHDEGIDGVIKEDRLGLDSIYIQAKRYENGSVGRKEIQSFVGALSGKGATKGVFITTSKFTKDASEYKPASSIKIVLIDGHQLANYMIDYNIGVSTRQVFEIKRVDLDFFSEE